MKLLIENWKKFITEATDEPEEYDYEKEMAAEASELEQKHFGSIRELAKMAYDTYHEEMQKYKSKVMTKMELELYHGAMAGAVYHKSGKALLDGGRGVFRATFHYDKNYVIKIDATIDHNGRQMNREDKELGTDPQYEQLFPRCFFWDKNYDWIVLENVKPIDDEATLNSFFKTSLLRDNADPRYYTLVLKTVIKYKVGKMTKEQSVIDEAQKDFSIFKHGVTMNNYVTLDMLVKELDKNKTFVSYCNAVVRFDMSVTDSFRLGNTGVGIDGRFVVLDSSIRNSLIQGVDAVMRKV